MKSNEPGLARHLRDRYSRQTILREIGEEGQARLVNSRAVIIGCGALGSNIAVMLVRAGVGHVKIIDRDFIEYHNLQRQVLFNEEDVRAGTPKAIAAVNHLKEINSTVEVEGIVADVNFTNIEGFCAGADVILDGLDNIETRYLINDVSLKLGIPWVYGGAIMTTGMTMTIVPGVTPCFRCFSRNAPDPGTALTCETAGILGTVPAIIGSLQATEAIKLLVNPDEINRDLLIVDAWRPSFDKMKVSKDTDCPACRGRYEFLEKKFDVKVTSLCGQSRSIQVIDTRVKNIDLDAMKKRWSKDVKITRREYGLNIITGDYEIMVFPDGRAIIKGTIDASVAKELFEKYVKPTSVKS
jgi:molybdopterin/thiamine biosynthesis adenylyltransferase